VVQSNDDIWVKIRNAWNDEHEQREVYNRESGNVWRKGRALIHRELFR
jgi:hypothetical protein